MSAFPKVGLFFLILSSTMTYADSGYCGGEVCRGVTVTAFYGTPEPGSENEARVEIKAEAISTLTCDHEGNSFPFSSELSSSYQAALEDMVVEVQSDNTKVLDLSFNENGSCSITNAAVLSIDSNLNLVNDWINEVNARNPKRFVSELDRSGDRRRKVESVILNKTDVETSVPLQFSFHGNASIPTYSYELSPSQNETLRNDILTKDEVRIETEIDEPLRSADCENAVEEWESSSFLGYKIPYLNNVTCNAELVTSFNAGRLLPSDLKKARYPIHSGTIPTETELEYTYVKQNIFGPTFHSYRKSIGSNHPFFIFGDGSDSVKLEHNVIFTSISYKATYLFEGEFPWVNFAIYTCTFKIKNSHIQGQVAIHSPNCEKDNRIIFGGHYNKPEIDSYDRKRYTDLTFTQDGIIGSGPGAIPKMKINGYTTYDKIRKFEIRPGYVPISVSGITTFIKAPVKKYVEAWKDHSTPNNIETSNIIAVQNGWEIGLACDNVSKTYHQLTFGSDTFTDSDIGELRSPAVEKCGELAKYRLIAKNIKNSDDYAANEVVFKIIGSTEESWSDYARNYDTTVLSDVLFEREHRLRLLEKTLLETSTPEDKIQKAIEFSVALKQQMKEWKTDQDVEIDVNSYFVSFDSTPPTGCEGRLNLYKPLCGDSSSIPTMAFADFEQWTIEQNLPTKDEQGNDIYPPSRKFLPSKLLEIATRFYTTREEPDTNFYGCRYQAAYKDFTDALTLANWYVQLVQNNVSVAEYPNPESLYGSVSGELAKKDSEDDSIGGMYKALKQGRLVNPFDPHYQGILCPID